MRYQVVEDSYVAFHGDEDDDEYETHEEELNINWCVLFARVVTIFLMVCFIVSFSLGKIDNRCKFCRTYFLIIKFIIIVAICLLTNF
jgi:hypothetical protein